MDTGDVTDWKAFWDEINRPGPHSQLDVEGVALFSEGDGGGAAFWMRTLDKFVYIPKAATTRTQHLNRFVNLCLASQLPDTMGFQLESFSLAAPRIWEMLGRDKEERVLLGEILRYYEAISIGTLAGKGFGEFQFQTGKIRELCDLFGHITILQPNHARTIPL